MARHTLSIGHQKAGPSPWLRQIGRGRRLLVYRDLPPAIVRAPGWFEDPRFACYTELLAVGAAVCSGPGAAVHWGQIKPPFPRGTPPYRNTVALSAGIAPGARFASDARASRDA